MWDDAKAGILPEIVQVIVDIFFQETPPTVSGLAEVRMYSESSVCRGVVKNIQSIQSFLQSKESNDGESIAVCMK